MYTETAPGSLEGAHRHFEMRVTANEDAKGPNIFFLDILWLHVCFCLAPFAV